MSTTSHGVAWLCAAIQRKCPDRKRISFVQQSTPAGTEPFRPPATFGKFIHSDDGKISDRQKRRHLRNLIALSDDYAYVRLFQFRMNQLSMHISLNMQRK